MKLRLKAYQALWSPSVKRILARVPVLRRIYDGWSWRHPLDTAYGIDTSGVVSADECAPGSTPAAHMSPYAGSQPSIVRTGLALRVSPARIAGGQATEHPEAAHMSRDAERSRASASDSWRYIRHVVERLIEPRCDLLKRVEQHQARTDPPSGLALDPIQHLEAQERVSAE
jgi:hypothetical protein